MFSEMLLLDVGIELRSGTDGDFTSPRVGRLKPKSCLRDLLFADDCAHRDGNAEYGRHAL